MNISSLGYVGLRSTKAADWATFGPEVLGLQLAGGEEEVRLRTDDRAWRLAVSQGDSSGLAYLGWELPDDASLEAAYRALNDAGRGPAWAGDALCSARGVERMLTCTDPAGNVQELFTGQARATEPFAPGRPDVQFASGDLGFGHVVLGVADIDACRDFYTDVLGLRISDVFDNPRLRMAFMHCNPRHHSLALGTQTIGLHHLMIEVASMDEVGATLDLCQQKAVDVVKTLGRHSNDLVFSFYLDGPGGIQVEYGANSRIIDEGTWQVEQLRRASLWGHQFTPGHGLAHMAPAAAGAR
ncbi:MAG: VOC family protein [Chloroflexi bacterium]|nr:VOC family protein [Chloroflexota bacterium]